MNTCPNPKCQLLFASNEEVVAHLDDETYDCGASDYNPALSQNGFSDDLEDDASNELPEDAATPLPPTGLPPLASLNTLFFKRYHPNVGVSQDGGQNLLQAMDNDDKSAYRRDLPYYPFASKEEWELVKWMSDARLTQSQINSFLRTSYAERNPLSFKSAQVMQACIEGLPNVPRWQHQTLQTFAGCDTTTPMTLYWRNPLKVVRDLYRNPVFSPCFEHNPYKLYSRTRPHERIFGEFMSGDFAWNYQNRLPPGHTMAGVILASDKTPLTIATGDKEMHPLLLSLANIDAGVRMKASSRAFALIAYIPTPKFIGVSDHARSILLAQMFHFCLDIILKPLKDAEKDGIQMSDTDGKIRTVHTPLVGWLADYIEQQLIACVAGSQSPVTTASLPQFGQADMHSLRTRMHTLKAIREVVATNVLPDKTISLNQLEPLWDVCHSHGVNGVLKPLWEDWGYACPSEFLPHDSLHGLHIFFWDHVVKWAINIMTGEELDVRLRCIQPRVGFRHWTGGVSTLRQISGGGFRDLEKVFIGAINGGVDSRVLQAFRAIMDFIFQAQKLLISETDLDVMSSALREFHSFKASIVEAGGRRGKRPDMDQFNIPKLEMLQIIARSTALLGAPYQWTTDVTERCHITHVKTPYRMSNRRDFHEQCVRYMDRVERINNFALFVTLKHHGASLVNNNVGNINSMADHYPEQAWLSQVAPEGVVGATKSVKQTNLFTRKSSFATNNTDIAISLNVTPHHKRLSIEEIAKNHSLPDFPYTIAGFFNSGSGYGNESTFDVWNGFRIQQLSVQDPRILSPCQTIQALPCRWPDLPHGRCDTVLLSGDTGTNKLTTAEGGSRIFQTRLVFRLSGSQATSEPLLYGEYFELSPLHTSTDEHNVSVYIPAPVINMFEVRRCKQSSGARMAGIVPLSRVLQAVELLPRHGLYADRNLGCNNSLEVDDFYWNNFADKECFHTLLSYQ